MEIQGVVRHLGLWSSGRGSLQQKLARALMDAIRQGLMNPGLRLPSERALAEALKISRTTVATAYDALRELGWLDSRSGSGTRVSARSSAVTMARSASQAAALATSPLLGLLDNQPDDDIVDFALGTPAPLTDLPAELFTLPGDEHGALLRDRAYHPFGLVSLRRAIADEYSKIGLRTDQEEVLVTNGAQHALALCAMSYVQRGDTVLIEDPTYFGALDACRAVGARIATLPVEAGGVSPSAIRDRMTATAARLIYLTPTFQNPTGAVMPVSARRETARIVSELGVPVIDDRTMADLILEGSPPPPLAASAADAPILSIGSLSKLVWHGLRVGWIRAPEPVIQRLARLKSAMELGSPLLTQAIAARLVGALDEARALRKRQLKPRRDLLVALLQERLPEWTFRVPPGGLFLWVRLPRGDARQFAQLGLRHGVVTLPGSTLSADEAHTRFLRLPFLAEPETLRKGVGRLSAAWRDFQSGHRHDRRQHVAVVQ
jgi:DNA-binding transcriptional MocR family regulator